MGAKPAKLRRFYQKIKNRQRDTPIKIDNEDDLSYLLPSPKNGHLCCQESQISATSGVTGETCCFQADKEYSDELNGMISQLSTTIQTLKDNVSQIEHEHMKAIQTCFRRCNALVDAGGNKEECTSHKLDQQMEECRLRNALIQEKIKNCQEYLSTYDSLLQTVNVKCSKEDTFLRRLLFKTAKRQYRKNRLSDAIESLCQLIVATSGQLCETEIWLLYEIVCKKVKYTHEFYQKITTTVKEIGDASSKYIMDELWTSVIDDLRTECSDTLDMLMKVKVPHECCLVKRKKKYSKLFDYSDPIPLRKADKSAFIKEEHIVIEILKYVMISLVTALLLQITPRDHDEFDDIKNLLFDSIDQYAIAFASIGQRENNAELITTVDRIITMQEEYSISMDSKRMNKVLIQLQKLQNTVKCS